MRKRSFILSACAVAMTVLMGSCGGNGQKNDESTDATPQETVKPFNGLELSKYNATFFTADSLMSETPSDSTYLMTPSGLKYVIVQEGTGKNPLPTEEVTVHYVGQLPDGTVFDSSVARGEPATFPLNRVIAGWTEGLQLMKEGGVAVFYIPSDLGYGAQGSPGVIPPDSPLIFQVQLLQTY